MSGFLWKAIQEPTFWVLVAFLIFIVISYKPLTQRLFSILDNRSQEISDRIEEAQTLLREAQELLSTYKNKYNEGLKQVQEILSHAEEEVARLKQHKIKELEEMLLSKNHQVDLRLQNLLLQNRREVREALMEKALDKVKERLRETASQRPPLPLIEEVLPHVQSLLTV